MLQLTIIFIIAGEFYPKLLIQSRPPQLTATFTIANGQLKLMKLERSMEQTNSLNMYIRVIGKLLIKVNGRQEGIGRGGGWGFHRLLCNHMVSFFVI